MGSDIGNAYRLFFDQFVAAAAVDSDPATWSEDTIKEWRILFDSWESHVTECS